MSILNTISTTVVTAYFLKKLFEKDGSRVPETVETSTGSQIEHVSESDLLEWLKMNFQDVKKQFEASIGQHLSQEDFVAYLEKLGIDARKLFDQ
ncbi:hypothetical protein [Phaeocystidibacter marisrubri]|uniref:hypothetical protein n=1 Tax=Phaeocystidibacter marisrubri TaxID=1577780 RepID=UPI00166B2F40|nr:hypothetical protein [Phaeocystidibacter marisrubri]GGH78136.1 hypothetical protein GCM10011318_28900 [Phaeocystidibacter marisrubri]GGH78153.1 hypothetical protein GCM10011318_28940 [Phaeocystidibacter marisrubri]